MAAAVERAVKETTEDLGFLRLDPTAFAQAPQKSIDYAVMECTDRAAVVTGDLRWSDIGSWDALFDICPRDSEGNVRHGPVITLDAQDCIVHSNAPLTTLIGVKDLVVVAMPDAVLVMPRSRSQEVRELVAKLKTAKRAEATDHRRVHRPWGYYESIDVGTRFQVKRIVVVPGGVLSLQKHRHRAEH
jgi:mannose-1-phosphate guanylyltransferase/mannose-6-phosphate isomerase